MQATSLGLLQLPQLLEQAILLQQLPRWPRLNDAATLKYHNPIKIDDRSKAMGDHEGSPAGEFSLDEIEHRLFGLLVEAGR